MSLHDVISTASKGELFFGGSAILIIILSCVQISKIEINPWTSIGKFFKSVFAQFGKMLNSDLNEHVDRLENDIATLSKEITTLNEDVQDIRYDTEASKAKQRRRRILRFGDELRAYIPHSREHFDEILHDISQYEHYCNTHPEFENDKAVLTIEYIKDIYKLNMEQNSFL